MLSFFPLDVLDEILNLIESVSEDFPSYSSYGVYISQLIQFARVSSDVDDFNTRNKVLTATLLRQAYRWFFGDFRCGVPLFIVILVICKYEKR